MRRTRALVSLLVLIAGASIAAQPGAKAIDTLLTTAVQKMQLPMAVAMVANTNGVIYERAVGTKPDAIFAIASMTKPVTSVAVMQLVEAGRVNLDEPASTYLKELASIQVYDGGKMRAPKSPPTVRQLLTHTAGFGYEFFNADLIGLVAKKQVPSMMLGDDAFLTAPLLFDPGARWEYGINTDWLGRLVERVSGQTLEAYFQQKIFQPLGMADSFFNVPDAKRSRMVPIFAKNADGSLAQQPTPPAKPVVFFSGGGGLFSTAADYVRFMRALLQGGQLDGKRILSAESVSTMGQNHLGALNVRLMGSQVPQLASNSGVMVGSPDKFGLGFAVNSKPTAAGRSANTMSWAGIYNTFFWIDREKQVAAVFMTQLLPFLEPGVAKVVEDFDRADYAMDAH